MVTGKTCKVSILSKMGTTSNMLEHLATQHAIHLQNCCVFDTLLLSNASDLRISGANGTPSVINAKDNFKFSWQDRPCLLS